MDYCIWKLIDVRTRCHQAFTYDRSLSLLYWQMVVCHPFRIRIMRRVSLLSLRFLFQFYAREEIRKFRLQQSYWRRNGSCVSLPLDVRLWTSHGTLSQKPSSSFTVRHWILFFSHTRHYIFKTFLFYLKKGCISLHFRQEVFWGEVQDQKIR